MIKDSQEVETIRGEFDAFYQTNLSPLFEELEKSRKKYLKYFYISAFVVFIVLPLSFLWQLDNIKQLLQNNGGFEDVFDKIMFVYLLLAGVVAIPISAYKKKNKKVIMPEFVKFFNGFSFIPKQSIPTQTINKSELFNNFSEKTGDDYFCGSYKGVDVIISEELLERVTHNSKGQRREITIFKGVFVSLEMNKNFEGQTVGKKDKGFFNRFNKISGFECIKLEDPVFEKEWEIYATNQIESRYLLTTAFMERLLKVKNIYHSSRLQFSFFDNILFLAIDMKGDMFETSSLFKSTFDRKHIDETLEQFLSILAIVDILKLNQRIGM